jgi:hypothetical protein
MQDDDDVDVLLELVDLSELIPLPRRSVENAVR